MTDAAKSSATAATPASRPGDVAAIGIAPEDVTKGAKRVRMAHKGDTWVNDGKTYTGTYQDVPASKVVALIKAARVARVHLRVTDPE